MTESRNYIDCRLRVRACADNSSYAASRLSQTSRRVELLLNAQSLKRWGLTMMTVMLNFGNHNRVNVP